MSVSVSHKAEYDQVMADYRKKVKRQVREYALFLEQLREEELMSEKLSV